MTDAMITPVMNMTLDWEIYSSSSQYFLVSPESNPTNSSQLYNKHKHPSRLDGWPTLKGVCETC